MATLRTPRSRALRNAVIRANRAHPGGPALAWDRARRAAQPLNPGRGVDLWQSASQDKEAPKDLEMT